jgi:hypothetical protein
MMQATTDRARSTAPAMTPAPATDEPAAAPTPASFGSAAPEALEIFDRTRARVAARVLPPFIAYTEYAAFMRHGKIRAQHDRVILRTADGRADITPVPDSAQDRIDGKPSVDRPIVNPTTSFGLVKRRTGETASPYETQTAPLPEPAADAAGPHLIGHVSSHPRDYDPTLIGIEQIGGARVYHLKLVPRFDPQHHPIRDLYVDTQTYDPRRMAIEVFAAVGPVRSRPTVVVDFAPVDSTWMIDHASMDFVLRLAFLAYGGSAEYRTSEISFPASEPDWLFDAKELAEHLRAQPAPAASRQPE